MSLKQLGRWNN
ncbi:hypothetical protein VCHENC02_4042A, partial [Vibrio harveyi]